MKKIIITIILLVCIMPLFAQRVEIYYDDPVLRVTDVPIYLFQRYCPPNNLIIIEDTSFIDYLHSEILSFKDTDDYPWYKKMPFAMIQIVYIESEYRYHVINMSHSPTSKTIDEKSGCLILDGKNMKFNKSFQSVIDQVVNYHIDKPKDSIDFKFILNGGRYLIDPYLPKFP